VGVETKEAEEGKKKRKTFLLHSFQEEKKCWAVAPF
jgi:hypothetical protein